MKHRSSTSHYALISNPLCKAVTIYLRSCSIWVHTIKAHLQRTHPYWHIREFFDLCRTQNVKGLTPKEIRLILFPFSLKDSAKIWYNSLATGSIHTWDEMATKFLKKFFPSHKTRQLKREILAFQQKDGDLFFEA